MHLPTDHQRQELVRLAAVVVVRLVLMVSAATVLQACPRALAAVAAALMVGLMHLVRQVVAEDLEPVPVVLEIREQVELSAVAVAALPGPEERSSPLQVVPVRKMTFGLFRAASTT